MFRLFSIIFRPFKNHIQVYQSLRCILGSRTLRVGIIFSRIWYYDYLGSVPWGPEDEL